jgi:hypothetical protein
MNSTAIVDWLSVTVKGDRKYPDDLPDGGIERKNGMLGYAVAIDTAFGAIMCFHPGRPDMGTHLVYSGKALRTMETDFGITPHGLVSWYQASGAQITRLDIAMDVKDGFTAKDAIKRYENGECATRLKVADKVQSITGKGDTLYIGRRGGEKMLRIYDKAAEQKVDGVWTRVEAELRGATARKVAEKLLERNKSYNFTSATIKGIADFPLWDEWLEALGGVSWNVPTEERAGGNTEEWLLSKVAPAIAKFSIEHDGWLEKYAEHINLLIAELLDNQRT